MTTVATHKRARIFCLIFGPVSLLAFSLLLSGSSPPVPQAGIASEPPTSRITYPSQLGYILRLGSLVTVRATGVDPDSASTTGLPVAYLVKVLRLDTLDPPISILAAQTNLLLQGADSTWTRYEGSSLDVAFNVPLFGEYILGVRAVAESDSTEHDLVLGRNAFKFVTVQNGGLPDITLQEPSTGTFRFRGTLVPAEAETPGNTGLHFTWSADLNDYGGVGAGWSWGVDLADPMSEEGWTPWSFYPEGAHLQFAAGSTHTFHIRTRDTVGAITRGTLTLQVIETPFDREVLVVDDSFDNLAPRDSEHDAFWQDLVDNYLGYSNMSADQFFTFDVFGDGDRGNLQPNVPSLSDLVRYKVIIWVANAAGYDSQSGLIQCAGVSTKLAAYLRAGGKLWLEGKMTVAGTIVDANGVGADLTYPIEHMGPGFFAWDYLKLHSAENQGPGVNHTQINDDKGVHNENLMHSVWPFPGVPAIYDSMLVDVSKLPLLQQNSGGFSFAEAVFNPILAESELGFEGDIDTLYAYGAAGPEVQGHGSVYHGKLCALRWHDTSLNPVHGRVQWFGFPLYYFNQAEARETFRKSLDWLRQPDGVVPVQHLSFTGVREGSQVVVRWDVAEEWQSSAFYIYREETGRDREKVSAAFSGSSHYEFVDRNAPSGPVSYWINELDRTGAMSWYGPMAMTSSTSRTLLAPVLPNPIVDRARLAYTLERPGHVALSVHDVSGRQVALLVNDTEDAGRHELTWNPMATGRGRLAAGFYVIRLQTETASDVKKVLVLP